MTERDIRLIRDIALSHLLSRDQIIALGYFSSITRANTRLRELATKKLIRRMDTPFFVQSLYMAGPLAHELLETRVAKLLESRTDSPRFVRHALAVTNARIALTQKGGEWRFEQQLWRTLPGKTSQTLRPDGLVITSTIPIFIEVDMGNVSIPKFKEKLSGYAALAHPEICQSLYGFSEFRLLTVTTGTLRSRNLRSVMPQRSGFAMLCQTFEEIGASLIPNWS
ncbi:MAG: replication-relaxation family protein [Armatimonadetes bacterium]|nr:replication-relaxation family protein [Armatimonadota bacterium]